MYLFYLWIALFLSGRCTALQKPNLTAPATADARQPFSVQCRYGAVGDAEDTITSGPANEVLPESGGAVARDVIQSLKLYAAVAEQSKAAEIFRFTPSEEPQSHQFEGPARVERSTCARGAGCRVTLRARAGRLRLRCELSGEGPTFEIADSETLLDVIAEPVYGPTIVGGPEGGGGGAVSAGDVLLLNCSTDLAAPPAFVYWTLDGTKLEEAAMSAVAYGQPDELGLRKSWRSARVAVPCGDGERDADVSVSCVAAQPAPGPPRERRAELLLERAAGPRISKYTAASASTSTCSAVALPSLCVLLLTLQHYNLRQSKQQGAFS